jgi:excinuclease ABC subunit B
LGTRKLKQLEDAIYKHAKNREFEQAEKVRDAIRQLQNNPLG